MRRAQSKLVSRITASHTTSSLRSVSLWLSISSLRDYCGNEPSIMRGGVITRPLSGVPRCVLALAWLKRSSNPLIGLYAQAADSVVNAGPDLQASLSSG